MSDENHTMSPERPPETPEEKAEREVMALYKAALDAGVRRADPISPLIVGIANYGQFLSGQRTQIEGVINRGIKRFDTWFDGRHRDDRDHVDRLETQIDLVYARATDRVADAMLGEVGERSKKTARTEARLSFAVLIVVGLVIAAVCLIGGWYGGQKSAAAELAQSETALRRAAFGAGADRAELWLKLMRYNDISQALAACTRDNQVSVQNGQQMCRVPLWTSPRPAAQTF